MTKQYLLGALHDATKRKTTFRLGQKSEQYVQWIAQQIKSLGGSAWMYREGSNRQFYIVEFSRSFLQETSIDTIQDKAEYIAGYFDTDGGIAKTSSVRYYLYFSQKNYQDLVTLKQYLKELGIHSGAIHNPSKSVDPNYWRFFISARSYTTFAKVIKSQHPEKKSYIRMKI